MQQRDYKGFVTLAERNKDIDAYLSTNEFEIGDVSLFFSKRAYYEAGAKFFDYYASQILESEMGRGSAFRRFYEYLLSHSDAANYVLEHRYLKKIPLNSINFGNFLGELYWFIQERKISQDVLYRIQNEYLSKIKSENLTKEYQIAKTGKDSSSLILIDFLNELYQRRKILSFDIDLSQEELVVL